MQTELFKRQGSLVVSCIYTYIVSLFKLIVIGGAGWVQRGVLFLLCSTTSLNE